MLLLNVARAAIASNNGPLRRSNLFYFKQNCSKRLLIKTLKNSLVPSSQRRSNNLPQIPPQKTASTARFCIQCGAGIVLLVAEGVFAEKKTIFLMVLMVFLHDFLKFNFFKNFLFHSLIARQGNGAFCMQCGNKF